MLQLGYNLHALGQTLDDSLIAIVMIISLPNSIQFSWPQTQSYLPERSKPPSYKRNSYARGNQHQLSYRCRSKRKETKVKKAKIRENKQTGMTREIRERVIVTRSADMHHVVCLATLKMTALKAEGYH
jgi:hypothetical protein